MEGEHLTCLTFTDLSSQRAAETERLAMVDRLHQMQRTESLGQLAAGVAHDFNNLFAIILNYAALISDETGGQVRADAEEIRVAAQFASRLTRQLLTFARPASLHLETLDVGVVLREMFELLNGVIGVHTTLVVHADASPAPIRADRGQVDQILLNLVINARDAMPDGGTVTWRRAASAARETAPTAPADADPDQCVELSIADTGTGMDAGIVARAFERYFTTKPDGQGYGLGLATVHGIVTATGGTIAISSVLGTGTTITVTLPAGGS